MTNEKVEIFLKSRSVKPTANRILVVRELEAATHPVSLSDLELTLHPMDKASIFRVLELLSEKEIVHVIEDGSRSLKYELCMNQDHHSVSDQHIHFYCEQCKETYCIEDVSVPTVEIPAGFLTRSVNYMLKGLCPKCSAKN